MRWTALRGLALRGTRPLLSGLAGDAPPAAAEVEEEPEAELAPLPIAAVQPVLPAVSTRIREEEAAVEGGEEPGVEEGVVNSQALEEEERRQE